jgi:hypothetical protein
VHDVYVHERQGIEVAYVNCLDKGLVAFDLASREVLDRYPQPSSHSVSVTTANGRDLLVFSSEAYASGIEVATWDEHRGFALLGLWGHGSAASVHNIVCDGALCLVSAYQEGWLALDVSHPSVPVARRRAGTWQGPGERFLEGASGVARLSGLVFVADTERGLMVYQPSGD